jgi:hypothetical protein
MEIALKNKLASSFSSGLRPVYNGTLWDWLAENISLPNVYHPEGRFDINFYPYLKRPMLDMLDDNIKQVNLVSAVQAGKSLCQQVFLPYVILESPGSLLMIHDTQENAKRCVEERIIPLLKNNKTTKGLIESDRFAARKSGVTLPHMIMRVCGPAESNLVAFSARYVIGDEIWQWQASHHVDVIEKLKNRQVAYNANKKMILSSQPDYEGSDLHKQCTAGMWWEYGFKCPHCRTLQLYEWNGEKDGHEYGMIFDKTEKDKDDIPDYDKKAASARIVCQHCFKIIEDTPQTRKQLVMEGDYILVHSGNDTSIHTYSWSQYLNIGIPFKQISLQYFNSVIQKRTTGLLTKHELFRQQTLGRFWKVGHQVEVRKLMVEAYQSFDEWKDETIRFMTCDVQKDCIYWLCRSWSNRIPESRLLDWGVVVNFGELEEIIAKFKIHPLCIGVDSGYESRNIYAESVQRGKVIVLKNGKREFIPWTCYKGDGGKGLTPKKFYRHKIEENGKTLDIDRLYSTLTMVDPQFPVGSKFKPFKAKLYAWSNYSIKFILKKLIDGTLPFKWSLNSRATAEYTQQLFSEELDPKSGRYIAINPKNHLFDVECLSLVMALQADCYHPAPEQLNDITASPELTP